MSERAIVDASAMVDLLVGTSLANEVADRLRGNELHAPAHFDAEVFSALGRLHRAGHLTARQTEARIERLATAPVERHALSTLVVGAWKRRHNLRLVDALYVELASQLDMPIITTDSRMAAATGTAEHSRSNVPRAHNDRPPHSLDTRRIETGSASTPAP